MITHIRPAVAFAAALIVIAGLTACTDAEPGMQPTSTPDESTPVAQPTASPATGSSPDPYATVVVTTLAQVTVVDGEGSTPQLCGSVAESLPPQCDGIDLVGWDWGFADGSFEERGGVRWGEYVVTGVYSFDTDELTIESAAAGGDDIASPWGDARGATCLDGHERTPEESRPVYDELVTQFVTQEFGVQSYWWGDDGCGALSVGVAFDDGRIQSAVDEEFGGGGVVIVPLLWPIE